MKNYAIGAFAAIIALGALYLIMTVLLPGLPAPVTPLPVPPEGPIAIEGTMVCLPHRDTSGPQTAECAFGLKDDSGRYFALSDTDPDYGNIAGVPMNERVRVEGEFAARSDTLYQDIGIIRVAHITRLSLNGGVGEFWGGIMGTVLLGPTCPVEQYPPQEECADRPYAASLVLTTPDGARVIQGFSSGEDGRFSIEVPPGEYAIRSAAAANILPYCSSQGIITVRANDTTTTDVSCDSGIR